MLLPSLAAAQKVTVDYDHDYDFSKIENFAVAFASPTGDPLAEARVVVDVEEALIGKGWKKTAPEEAQAIVLLHGATEERRELQTFYSGGGGWRWRGMGGATTTEVVYTVGTLVVDIYDLKTKHLVFRGIASDELAKKAEKRDKKVEKAMTKMFKDFPPSP